MGALTPVMSPRLPPGDGSLLAQVLPAPQSAAPDKVHRQASSGALPVCVWGVPGAQRWGAPRRLVRRLMLSDGSSNHSPQTTELSGRLISGGTAQASGVLPGPQPC